MRLGLMRIRFGWMAPVVVGPVGGHPGRRRHRRTDLPVRVGRSAPDHAGRVRRASADGARPWRPLLATLRTGLRLGLLLCFGLAAPFVSAQTADDEVPFTIVADQLEREATRDIYVARGNVHLEQGDQSLDADWVMFSAQTRNGIASGNVVRRDGPDTLTGDFLQFNIDTLQGYAEDATLTSAESLFTMTGGSVRKTGRETYVIEDGTFTTCDCPDDDARDPWRLRAKTADLDLEGYAVAKNGTLEVLGVPVAWLPYAVYPIKRERQSGFLFPEVDRTSRRGWEVGLPFFWAARPNVNLTVTGRYSELRGFKPEVNGEYVWGERSSGDFFATWIRDMQIESNDPSTPFPRDRWGVGWDQDWHLPYGARFKIDATVVADNEFPFDFDDFREERINRFIESRAFVAKSFGETGRWQSSASVWWADDLQSPDNEDRDDFVAQRLPDVAFNALSGRIHPKLPIVFGLEGEYTYFTTKDDAASQFAAGTVVGDEIFIDSGIDGLPNGEERNASGIQQPGDANADDFGAGGGPEGDGEFQEGELIADEAHRLFLNPRLSAPFDIAGVVEVAPEVGYHLTLYGSEAQGFVERGMVTGRLDVRSRFRRSFSWFGGAPVSHQLEPFLSWGLVQQTSQSDNPLFIPETATPQERVRLFDLDTVTRDPADRIDSFNGFTAGFDNKFFRKAVRRVKDPDTGEVTETVVGSRLLADVAVAASYAISGSEFGFLAVDGRWYPSTNWVGDFAMAWDLSDSEIDEAAATFGYRGLAGSDFQLRYRYLRTIPLFFESFDGDRFDEFESAFARVNQLSLNMRWAVNPNWALTYQMVYTFEEGFFLQNLGGIEYTSRCSCWAVRLEARQNRSLGGLDFGFRYTLLGLGDQDPVRPFSGGRRRRDRRDPLDADEQL